MDKVKIILAAMLSVCILVCALFFLASIIGATLAFALSVLVVALVAALGVVLFLFFSGKLSFERVVSEGGTVRFLVRSVGST